MSVQIIITIIINIIIIIIIAGLKVQEELWMVDIVKVPK